MPETQFFWPNTTVTGFLFLLSSFLFFFFNLQSQESEVLHPILNSKLQILQKRAMALIRQLSFLHLGKKKKRAFPQMNWVCRIGPFLTTRKTEVLFYQGNRQCWAVALPQKPQSASVVTLRVKVTPGRLRRTFVCLFKHIF